jgi:hypothetical protein
VPTIGEWEDVLANNVKEFIGDSWESSATNYDTGLKLGASLFLPAAGFRDHLSGGLEQRGDSGRYWTSDGENAGPFPATAGLLGFSTYESEISTVYILNRCVGFSIM